MAWSFGDSFDLYAAFADMGNGYWDAPVTNGAFVAGRFAGSRAFAPNISAPCVKSSGVNDAVHHFVFSFEQTSAITGSTLGLYFELFDGATAQCSVVCRSDGAILLTSGGPAGTVLATYAGAFPVASTWYAFECEVVINNTTGSFAVRKNGNNVNDFFLGSLNTRPTSTNNYANKLQLGLQASVGHLVDDLFWRSDASSVAWLGDIRCYARMPASDASVQFTKSLTSSTANLSTNSTTGSEATAVSRYTQFLSSYTGTIGSIAVNVNTGFTGNLKLSLFADTGATAPGAVLGSATTIANPVTGMNTLTFGTPVAVTQGVLYWFGVSHDVAANFNVSTSTTAKSITTIPYASFPTASPSPLAGTTGGIGYTIITTISTNSCLVSDAQQDGLTSYVYDSTPGDADFYGVSSIASTPAVVIATTIRAYAQKSDAGTRTMAVQLKSGATIVASPTLVLTTSGWQWAWRTDTVDPATGAAWTPAAVNNATIGPKVIA